MDRLPDNIKETICFAEGVLAKEKQVRNSGSSSVVLPMKFFLFHDANSVTALVGSPFEANELDEEKEMSLAIRLFAIALDAYAVLYVTEGWSTDRCAHCGGQDPLDGDCCSGCGGKVVPVAE